MNRRGGRISVPSSPRPDWPHQFVLEHSADLNIHTAMDTSSEKRACLRHRRILSRANPIRVQPQQGPAFPPSTGPLTVGPSNWGGSKAISICKPEGGVTFSRVPEVRRRRGPTYSEYLGFLFFTSLASRMQVILPLTRYLLWPNWHSVTLSAHHAADLSSARNADFKTTPFFASKQSVFQGKVAYRNFSIPRWHSSCDITNAPRGSWSKGRSGVFGVRLAQTLGATFLRIE